MKDVHAERHNTPSPTGSGVQLDEDLGPRENFDGLFYLGELPLQLYPPILHAEGVCAHWQHHQVLYQLLLACKKKNQNKPKTKLCKWKSKEIHPFPNAMTSSSVMKMVAALKQGFRIPILLLKAQLDEDLSDLLQL